MRSLSPHLRWLALGLLVASAASPVFAQTKSSTIPGFQLQGEALGFSPLGSVNGHTLSDRVGTGPGFSVTATVGLRRNLLVGAKVAHFSGVQDDAQAFDDGGGLGLTPQPPPAAAYALHRRLIGTPIHGVVQLRQPIASQIMLSGELGAGITTFIERNRVASNGTTLFTISGYQHNFSALGGVGLHVGLGTLFELSTGVDVIQVLTDQGDIWADGDNPKFLTATLGIRYPRF